MTEPNQIRALWVAVKAIQRRLTSAAGGVPPSAHADTHAAGGTDPIDLSALVITGTVGAYLMTVGDVVFIQCPYAGTITEARIAGFDAGGSSISGDAVADIWKATEATYPPDVGDSIVSATPPTLSGDDLDVDVTLSSWDVDVAAGDWFGFSWDSGDVDHILVQLTILRI